MIYRTLGKTGLKVSEIGYGGEHLVGKPYDAVETVVNTALDGGVNIVDVFMPQPEVRSFIGRAIGSRRKDVVLQGHIGSTLEGEQYLRTRNPKKCDEFVKDFLTRFNTDYIDLGMIHFIDTETDYFEAFNSPFIDYVLKLKNDGVIRFIGASTHDASTGIKMVSTGIVDMLMFSINPAFDFNPGMDSLEMLFNGVILENLRIDPVRAEFYNLCAAKGIGVTAMKSLGSGRLLNAKLSSLGYALTLPQCVAYALDRPAVSSVLLGAQTVDEMLEALSFENTTSAERNYAVAMQTGMPFLGGKCMYCNHCLPCPQGIDVAALTKYLDMAKTNNSDTIRAHYDALSAHGSDCTDCGSCEINCPFDIAVTENMKEAVCIFGK